MDKRNILVSVASLIVFFGIIEMIFIISGVQPYPEDYNKRFDPWINTMLDKNHYVPDDKLLFRINPRISKDINYQGFRSEDEFIKEKKENITRIAVMGDSVAFGVTTDISGSFPYILEEYLGKGYEVYNFGVPGYTTYQGTMLMDEVRSYSPDIIILCYGWNDMTVYKGVIEDKNARPASALLSGLLNIFMRSRAFQYLDYSIYRIRAKRGDLSNFRVSLEDHGKNLEEMIDQDTILLIQPAASNWKTMKVYQNYTNSTLDAAREKGITVVQPYIDDSMFAEDTIHPLYEGNEIIARELYDAIMHNI